MAIWRVLAVQQRDAVVWRQGQTRHVPLPDDVDARPGDLFSPTWQRLGHSLHRDFPHPDGDFTRLNADNGQRLATLHHRARLLAMLDGFVDLVTTDDAPPSACLFITRAEVEDATALDALHNQMMRLVSQPCMDLVARALGRPLDDEAKIRASAILGQALMFKKKGTKMGACPLLGWDAINETRLQTLKTILREQTTAIIRAAMDKNS